MDQSHANTVFRKVGCVRTHVHMHMRHTCQCTHFRLSCHVEHSIVDANYTPRRLGLHTHHPCIHAHTKQVEIETRTLTNAFIYPRQHPLTSFALTRLLQM